MPANRNALIRYTTIDKCLRNRFRKWTLEDLINACSNALYEFEGIDKGVSKRTIQMDIQNMRSEKLGYNAPIIVTDRKYYSYEDPNYSITQLPLSAKDIDKLKSAVELLKQFQEFSHFKDMNGLIYKLENKIHSEKINHQSIIDLDRNNNLKGLEHLNGLYQAILKKQALKISYQSFKAKRANWINFSPYLLKEFNNRWFLIGKRQQQKVIVTLALDRIQSFTPVNDTIFREDPNFNGNDYFANVIGVTVNQGLLPLEIKLWIDQTNRPYVLTKPLHWTQTILTNNEEDLIITIKVIPNLELERLILGFGSSIKVISPISLRNRIQKQLKLALENY